MNSPAIPARRHLVLIGILLSFIALFLGAMFLSAEQTIAQAEPGAEARTAAQPQGPPAPDPLSQPIATPDPDAAAPAASSGGSGIEALDFRPNIRLQRGQLSGLSQDASKPAGEQAPAQKPATAGGGGPQVPYQGADINGVLVAQNWNLQLYEDFEGVFPGSWIIEDFGDDCYYDNVISDTVCLFLDRSWGDTSYYSQVGSWSAWPAASGADALDPFVDWYSDGLNSWMEYQFDFSNMSDVFVSFGLWLDTEPSYDWMYFCASIDFVNYDCEYWSGYSGAWEDKSLWLTSYAGYSQVWLAWVFESDTSISAGFEGPFVDEVYVWGFDVTGTPTPTPTPDPGSQLILDGSFENGGVMPASWNTWSSGVVNASDAAPAPPYLSPRGERGGSDTAALLPSSPSSITSVGITNATWVEGQYAAEMTRPGGVASDYLWQEFTVPAGVTDLVLDFWSAVTTLETAVGMDYFCISLQTPAPFPDVSNILVDLGCTDALDATGYWQQVVYTLDDTELAAVQGNNVSLVFELYNDGPGGSGSAGWVDFVNVFAIGGSGGTYSDANEPNNSAANATGLACGGTASGIIGEAAGGFDIDWFRVDSVPTGRMDVDISADAQVPRSALDSVVYLYDAGLNVVAWNDDDGLSYDSYVVYTNTVANATYYVSVESYSGSGSLDSFYDLNVACSGTGSGSGSGGTTVTPTADTWTVMLYLNAEDPNFVSILNQYRTDIEAFIGSKSSFLKVVILYDGPNNNDTTRYLVQPNGSYTDGVNRWNLGELNMGHPDTLSDFVSWAMDQYPAENYYLAIDDHGDGAYGISVDSTSNNDLLTPPDVYTALKNATRNGDPNRKIDIFDYEACLMGLAENAYDVREWVNYVVFFEQISWGIDTYPSYFSDLAAADDPVTVGQRIIQRYHDGANVAGGNGFPHTISLIDTSQMSAVRQAVSNMADFIKATNTQAQKDAATAARDNSQAFANDSDATNPIRADYIDLWDLADNFSALAPSQAAAVKNAVSAAVVAERKASGGVDGFIWDHRGAHGLSIYYPPSTSSNAFGPYATRYRMSQDGTWDEFLTWVLPSGPRRGMFWSRAEDKLLNANAFIFKDVYLPVVIHP